MDIVRAFQGVGSLIATGIVTLKNATAAALHDEAVANEANDRAIADED